MKGFKTIIEPFKIKMVEPIKLSTEEERKQFLINAKHNTFILKAEQVIIDYLTDSGTSAQSANQWAGIMNGDESYAGSKSWERMKSVIQDLTGHQHVLPTHQGRAAERILYTHLGGAGKIFISNTHFDTTRANIEFTGAEAIDIPISAQKISDTQGHFNGDMDIEKLKSLVTTFMPNKIAAVILTVSNNSGGGQPVSMENAMAVQKICKTNNILFVLDCCRIAENSWFIRHFEQGYDQIPYKKIAQEMFMHCDIAVMSAKKDALANMGGFLSTNIESLVEPLSNNLILSEGYVTYGGLSGRDMESIAIGLEEIFDPQYLTYRIKSTAYLGNKLHEMGIPVILPIGGHAVYINAAKLYPHIPAHEYPGQALVCELYTIGGIRSCEIGSVMFGKYDEGGKLIPAARELVRLAIPRRVYTQSHVEYVLEVFEKVLAGKAEVGGCKIVKENKYLRHFTAHFERLGL